MSEPRRVSKRPLVVRFGALGDMIMLIPLLSALAERWGGPCDLVAAGGSPRGVMLGLDCVGEIHTIQSRKTPFFLSPGQWALVRWLRRRGPSPTYVVAEMPKVDWLLERGGIPASHRLSMGDLQRGDVEHAVAYYRRFGAQDPPHYRGRGAAPATVGDPRLAVSTEEIEDCRGWLNDLGWTGQPLVLFQTQSRRLKRGRWPEERWVAVVRSVLDALPEAWALLLGAPAEAPQVEVLRQACGDPRVHNAAHDLGLRRLFALTTLAHSCISLDSGPAHVAAACGCPVVVLMGMADPRRNRPSGPPGSVEIVTSVPEAEWPASRAEWEAWHQVAAIEVPAVVAAWRRLETG